MRKTTLTSLLILCGSTAAIANVATVPQSMQTTNNSSTMPMTNEATPMDQPMANEMTPINDSVVTNTPTQM